MGSSLEKKNGAVLTQGFLPPHPHNFHMVNFVLQADSRAAPPGGVRGVR